MTTKLQAELLKMLFGATRALAARRLSETANLCDLVAQAVKGQLEADRAAGIMEEGTVIE